MIAFENIIAIVLAFSIVTVSPGPANIAVAAVSMGTGRKQGLRFGFGLSLGLAFWGIVAATGMGAVLQSANQFLIALKILGGLYLLWLALQAGRSAMKKTEDLTSSTHQSHWFLRGLVLNLSNPKAVFAWMAALSMGLGNDGQISILVGATLICMMIGLINYSIYALAFSLPGFQSAYSKMHRWFDATVAVLFTLAGLSLIRSAFSR